MADHEQSILRHDQIEYDIRKVLKDSSDEKFIDEIKTRVVTQIKPLLDFAIKFRDKKVNNKTYGILTKKYDIGDELEKKLLKYLITMNSYHDKELYKNPRVFTEKYINLLNNSLENKKFNILWESSSFSEERGKFILNGGILSFQIICIPRGNILGKDPKDLLGDGKIDIYSKTNININIKEKYGNEIKKNFLTELTNHLTQFTIDNFKKNISRTDEKFYNEHVENYQPSFTPSLAEELDKIKKGFIDKIKSARSKCDIQRIEIEIINDQNNIVKELLHYNPKEVPDNVFHIYQEQRRKIMTALNINKPLYQKYESVGPSHIAEPYRGGKRRNTSRRNRKSKKTRKSRKNHRKSKRRSRR